LALHLTSSGFDVPSGKPSRFVALQQWYVHSRPCK
jgi:hypothetical protein